MNRTIKFRGKRVDNGEWVYGDLVINQITQTYRIFTDFANVRHGSYTDSGLHECSGELYHINPATIGQFTGLTDRNGKEIYEGDIVEYNNYDFQKQEQVNTTHEIIWWNDFSCFTLKNSESDLTFLSDELMEVIGNIHDK